MIAELYANMCGAELWNRARLSQYMANGIKPEKINLRCSPCESMADLIPCIEDQPGSQEPGLFQGYQLPELDPAPWYDPTVAESKNFAGMLILETAMSPAIDRRLVQQIGHGAVLTRTRFEGRTLTVRGLLIGRTCCAADYGLRWLTQALLGSYCGSCDGCALTFLNCTPSAFDDSECVMVEEDTGVRVPYFRSPESDDSEWTRGFDFVRQMFNTGLLQGPEVVSYSGLKSSSCNCSCGSMIEVEFTIGLGNPWLYEVEELVVADAALGGCDPLTCRVVFDINPDCDPFDPCPKNTECDDDPNCPTPPAPPPSGRLPLQQCGCLPMVVGRNCVAVPAGKEWFDQALIVEINAGTEPLRNLAIHAWQNPLGLDCCADANNEYFSDCTACATLLVGYIPAYGVLRFDSATRETTITCNNVTRPAAKNLATVEGLPFEWFEVGCQDVCLGVDIDCSNTSPDATLSVWRVGREL